MKKAFAKRLPFRELMRFSITGGVSTIVNYLIYYGLLGWSSPSIAFTVGYIVAFVVNYILTVRYTFKVKANAKNGIGFIASNLINYGISVLFLNLFIALGIPKALAPLPLCLVCIPVNFLCTKWVMKTY